VKLENACPGEEPGKKASTNIIIGNDYNYALAA
jgi:hypothetical protein